MKIIQALKKQYKHHHLILAGILLLTFVLRFPSLFEPFWYGDEGIFAAVARNLNLGGVLYETAWDNKPPMIYLTYQAIFATFGVSMFWLRLVTIVVVLGTAAVIYEIGQAVLGEKRALVASFIFGLITSLRLVEGNLALTEIFMVLPITLAMLVAIKRNFDLPSLFAAGFLFAIASLYKQVGALEAVALGIFVFLYLKSIKQIFYSAIMMGVGFAIPYVVTVLYFAPKKLVDDYIFAAYTYYRIYLQESPKYAIFINAAKFMAPASAILYGLFNKVRGKVEISHLFLLWLGFSFLGSYFSGRTYGHYLIQAAPAVALTIASIKLPVKLTKAGAIFAIFFFVPLIFLTQTLFRDFLSGGPLNQFKYWANFLDYARGNKSTADYNNYFDGGVNSIMGTLDFLKASGGAGKTVYIWGDWPWLYAIGDLWNPSRYVTSFHVFGVPDGKREVEEDLRANLPVFIIKPKSSIGYFEALEKILSSHYTFVAKVEGSEVWQRK
ncbi:glycosyltransferase family 39 protein [Candidatus Curtissbacteria bacterium]|nr:glycosyltransferase family 39 protein [Candidatus Curtissbacteria bacterium]